MFPFRDFSHIAKQNEDSSIIESNHLPRRIKMT